MIGAGRDTSCCVCEIGVQRSKRWAQVPWNFARNGDGGWNLDVKGKGRWSGVGEEAQHLLVSGGSVGGDPGSQLQLMGCCPVNVQDEPLDSLDKGSVHVMPVLHVLCIVA